MSNSIAVQQKRFIRLAPSNNSTVGYSPSASQPIIRFSVADTMATADMKAARLNFRVRINPTADAASQVAIGDDFNIDRRVGLSGVVDQVIVSSRRYGSQLEAVHNMGRLNSAWYDSLYSPKQMMSNNNLQTRAVGYGRYDRMSGDYSNASTLNDNGWKYMRKQLITGAGSATGKSSDLLDCSIPLHLGLFQSQDVNLNTVGGLEIAIYLQKERFLFNGTGAGKPTAVASYTLYDVSLTIPLLYYNANQIAALNSQPEKAVEFMRWTSIYSVLDSTFTSIAHRLTLRSLLSSIHNFQPTQSINDLDNNNFALKAIGLNELTVLRDGVKHPYEKTTIVDKKANNTLINLRNTTEAEVNNEAISAYRAPKDILYSQIIPENLVGVAGNNEGHHHMGVNYDLSAGSGLDVAGVISYDIKSKLEEQTMPTPTDTNTESYAMYSFYLDKQSLMITPSGIASM
tara:strand:+ start:7989 stop:9359 length:1371 start_codon:yes stop_codon:yes gene_type:complete